MLEAACVCGWADLLHKRLGDDVSSRDGIVGNNVEHGSFLVVLISGYATETVPTDFSTPRIVCAYPCDILVARCTLAILRFALGIPLRNIRRVYEGFHVRKRMCFAGHRLDQSVEVLQG